MEPPLSATSVASTPSAAATSTSGDIATASRTYTAEELQSVPNYPVNSAPPPKRKIRGPIGKDNFSWPEHMPKWYTHDINQKDQSVNKGKGLGTFDTAPHRNGSLPSPDPLDRIAPCSKCHEKNIDCHGWNGWACSECRASKGRCSLPVFDWLKRMAAYDYVREGGTFPSPEESSLRKAAKAAREAKAAEKTPKKGKAKKRGSTQSKKRARKVQEREDEKADDVETQETVQPVETEEEPEEQQTFKGKGKAKAVDDIDCEFLVF